MRWCTLREYRASRRLRRGHGLVERSSVAAHECFVDKVSIFNYINLCQYGSDTGANSIHRFGHYFENEIDPENFLATL